ncbi:MAG TPA: bifunctional riboflavin kinase/FAD synthetase [Acidimicrobiales bacterium]|nr:bifunctional riboflavin kinase/FAD synthetase [Acidimicrobiales bacterium]
MQVLRDLDECPRPQQGTVVTIGAYDGVHRGHREVIATMQRIADDRSYATAVVTFDRHPASVVRPQSAPRLLTNLDQKLELLEETGVDYALVIHFDEDRSQESAEDFVREVLVGCLNAKLVVVGADFHFGHRRRGNVPLLEEMGRELGFEVIGLALVGQDGAPARDEEQVSSTAIRRALVAGDVALAHKLLGREYEIRGTVERGDARGREWGFPTANVAVPDDILLPADGIYAGWYERPNGERIATAISLGRRPTVYDAQPYRLLEAHLLDWDGDLYGETARVRFVERLRDELKFDSVDALLEQIARDCDDARRRLDRR